MNAFVRSPCWAMAARLSSTCSLAVFMEKRKGPSYCTPATVCGGGQTGNVNDGLTSYRNWIELDSHATTAYEFGLSSLHFLLLRPATAARPSSVQDPIITRTYPNMSITK